MTQYFERVEYPTGEGYGLKPVDIGWRFCKDELPTVENWYLVILDNHWKQQVYSRWDGKDFYIEQGRDRYNLKNVVQWCKLMPPLKEDEE